MDTGYVRLNVTLPKDLVELLNKAAGPRSRSRFIAESIRDHIRQKNKADLEKQLEEGYRAAAKESITLAREFEAVDLEGWNEY
jgi:metal-responsive CopG/Arc/MetJ family transcriptional regulator